MKPGTESMSKIRVLPYQPLTPIAKVSLDIYGQLWDNFAKEVAAGPSWCQGTRTWMFPASQVA